MCMVLKSFKLSRNPLVHLFYLILIVSTVGERVVEEPAISTYVPTDENIKNVDKESTSNGGIKEEEKTSMLNKLINKFNAKTITNPTNTNEINNIGPNTPIEVNDIEDQQQDKEETDIDRPLSDVDKESTIIIEDQQQDDDEFPFNNMMLSQESTTPEILEPTEEEIDIDRPLSDVDKESTSNDGIKEEEKKNMINELVKRLNSKTITNPTNTNEINNIGPNIPIEVNDIEDQQQDKEEIDIDRPLSDVDKESTIIIEDQQQDDDEFPFNNMMLSQESTTPEILEPTEEEIDIDRPLSDVDKESTSNDGIKEEEKKNMINELVKRLNSKTITNPTNTNEINNIGPNTPIEVNDIEDQQQDKEEIDIDRPLSDVDKESTIIIEDQQQDDDEFPFNNMMLSQESTTPEILEPNEINNIGPNIPIDDNDIEDQQKGDDENLFRSMTPDLSPESTTLGDFEQEEMKEAENDQNTKDGITNLKKKKKKKKRRRSKNNSNIIPVSEDENMLHSLKPINSKDLIVSSLENVDIIKIKKEDPESEAKRKEKKKYEFVGFKPRQENARIYCTFLGNVLKMYLKVQKRFVGQFCHAVVIGTPIILNNYRVHLTDKMKYQLQTIYPEKGQSLLIVIMQYQKYRYWGRALRNTKIMKILITDIIHTVVRYKIDGIQFSNLHPMKETNQVNEEMMNHLIYFFEQLKVAAKKAKKFDLKIGITIDMHCLSIIQSLSSYKNLNSLVTWYSFKTISMVECTSKYETSGTSPLEYFKSTIMSLIGAIDSDFDMTKLVVGIQLFPNKKHDLHPYTYEELCSSPKNTWNMMCAANPEDLRLKGRFLRGAQIGGVQLYYMHSDDYRSTCGCYSFPLIRALLRGLIKFKKPETCDFKIAHN